jgi:hypothetical protein
MNKHIARAINGTGLIGAPVQMRVRKPADWSKTVLTGLSAELMKGSEHWTDVLRWSTELHPAVPLFRPKVEYIDEGEYGAPLTVQEYRKGGMPHRFTLTPAELKRMAP